MNRSELQLLYRYVSPYRKNILLIIILACFCGFFEAINIGALVPLLQLIDNPTDPGGELWTLISSFYSLIGIKLTFSSLLILICVLFLIGQGVLYTKKKLQNEVRFQFNTDLMNTIFQNTLRTDIRFHHSQKGGTFIEIINRESDQAATSLFVISELFTAILLIVVYFSMLLYISTILTALCAVIAVACFLSLNSFILRSKEFGLYVVDINSKMNEFVHERINLLKLIKIFSTEKKEEGQFKEITKTYADSNCAFMMNGVKIETIFQTIIFLIAVTVLFISTSVLNLSLPLLLIFVFILIRLTDPLRNLNSQRHVLAGQLASLEKVDQVINESRSAGTIKNGLIPFVGFGTSIELKNINYSYHPNNPVLSDVSFQISKNEMVALVGASGSGKSTLVDLIIRLMDPDSGEIKIDGINIQQFILESYHGKIGFVSQESFIFNNTILNNIWYGCDHASYEDAIKAAKIANAHDFISALPNGYQSEVGEKGVKLSGGEKQRLALARALYKNPEILILDEATSALDSESERIIQDSIAKIKHKYTIIVIAHRLSTIENADKIIVINKGNIVETGTHCDLLRHEGLYTKYYRLQNKGINGVP